MGMNGGKGGRAGIHTHAAGDDFNFRMLQFIGDSMIGGAPLISAEADGKRLLQPPEGETVAATSVVPVDVRAGRAIRLIVIIDGGGSKGVQL